jgi:2'-5' RNA ligase
MSSPASLWLMPSLASLALLSPVMGALADNHGTPRFQPHLTLDVHDAQVALERDFRRVAEALDRRSVSLTVQRVGHGPARFKTLYLEFDAQDVSLCSARSALGERIPPSSYVFNPHVSLMYAKHLSDMDEGARADLAQHLQERWIGEAVEFDRLALVSPGPHHDDWSEVADWTIVAQCEL